MAKQLSSEFGLRVPILLTDQYPNLDAFTRVAIDSNYPIDSMRTPVDARYVSSVSGFRTMFSSFHHFEPEDARQVLRSAIQCGQSIGVFEVAQRSPLTVSAIFLTPLFLWWITPSIRPFSWGRILWTYILPLVPFIVWFDGLISCLRAYSRTELEEMVASLEVEGPKAGYTWYVGEERSGILPVTYLIWCPADACSQDSIITGGKARRIANP